jgi:hypothetical protein
MRIIVFNLHNEIKKLIENAVKAYKDCKVVDTNNYISFKKEFSLSFSGETIIIFSVKKEEDLDFLESVHKDFMDIKLIIDLSDSLIHLNQRTLSLQPRIITNFEESKLLLPEAVKRIAKEKIKHRG